MPSTYSSNLKIELMSTGENSGTWGNITNTNLGTALEQAVVGYGAVNYVSDANLTISITNSNAAQAARALVLNVTSSLSLTGTRELVVPTIEKQYIVQNNTTGSQSITVKTSAGTGITVPNGRKAHLYVDGTNVIQMFDFVDINGGTIDGTPIGGSSAAAGSFTTLGASGAATFNGAVTLGDAAADLLTFNGTINSHLLFTDNTYDIGANGATRPRNLFLAGNATVGGNLSVGGTLTLTGGVNLNGNVTVGDNASDTLTINSTITSNLIFTDNTYDIGASGATRPRNLFLAGSGTIGGNVTTAGRVIVDDTTDSTSATTGSIQTDGGLGVAKALFVGTTVTINGGTANGVAYLNGSKVLTTGSALTFDGTTFNVTGSGNATSVIQTTGGAAYYQLIANNAVNASYNAVQSKYGSTVDWAISGGNGANGQIVFSSGGSEQMRLTSTGLGIGRTAVARLDSYTTVGNQSALIATATYTTGNAAAVITAGSNNGAYSGGYGLQVYDKTANGGGAQTGIGIYVAAPYDGTNASGGMYALTKYGIYVDDIYSYYGVNSSTGNYNWGIFIKGGANNYIAGNLGIGTVSPSSALYVKRTSGNSGIYTDYNGTNIGRIEAASNGNLYIGTTTGSGAVVIGTSANANALFLSSAGRLGVGNTSPSTILEVQGTTNSFIVDPYYYCSFKTGLTSYTKRLFGGAVVDDFAYIGDMYYDNSGAWKTPQTVYSATYYGGGQTIFYGGTGATANTAFYPVERGRFNSTGALVLQGGSTSADGVGVTFPASQSASSNANTLDDYEEGTYVVTLTPDTSGSITLNSSNNELSYIKVGSQVTIFGRVLISSVSSPVGAIRISMPFAPETGLADQSDFYAMPMFTHDVDLSAGALSVFGESSGSNYWVIYQTIDNAAWLALPSNNLKGNGNEYLYVTGSYRASA